MRVNVWGINYAPELTGIAVYNTGLCNYLADSGDMVTMVTAFPYYPQWKKAQADRGKFRQTDIREKVTVERCWLYVPERPTPWRRILHEFSFVVASFLRQLVLPTPDIYVVVSPPLLLGLAAWLISRIKGAPYVFHVQDLQPDAALGTQMLKIGPAKNLLYALERLSYKKAIAISAISPQMCQRITDKGISGDKLVYFPNWVDISALNSSLEGAWRKQNELESTAQLVSYCGNLGVKQAAEKIVEAASQLQDNSRVHFVVAGNGAEREHIRKLISDRGLQNLVLLDVLSEEEHTALLVDSDVCLITQKPGSATSFLPSKLLKTLALGRPIVTNAEEGSPLRDVVLEGGFGRVSDAGDDSGLATTIVELLNDEHSRIQMGKAGQEYVRQFEKETVLQRFRQFLLEKVGLKGKQ